MDEEEEDVRTKTLYVPSVCMGKLTDRLQQNEKMMRPLSLVARTSLITATLRTIVGLLLLESSDATVEAAGSSTTTSNKTIHPLYHAQIVTLLRLHIRKLLAVDTPLV